MKSQKGASSLISTMVYILISFVVIGIVSVPTVQLINKSKERANYNSMFEFFDKFEMALEDTISNKQITEVSFYNPGEIEIDCTNNKIIGRVEYSGEYKTEEVIVNDIVTYKKNQQIIFEKNLNNYERIQLNCGDKILSKGKNKFFLKNLSYDEEKNKILIDIFQNKTIEEISSWYSSGWAKRLKITIDHTKIEENLTNFPLLIDINHPDLLIAREDGKDVIFVDEQGNKLESEIEKITFPEIPITSSKKILDYYIEDMDVRKQLWIKTTIPANSSVKLKITKTPGYTPNGDKVFEFFDDFDDGFIDPNKWGYVVGYPYPLESEQNLFISGNTSFITSKEKLYSYDRIFKMRMYPVSNTSSYDCAMQVMGDCEYCGYNYNKGIGFGTNINSTKYEIFASHYCGATTIYASADNSQNGKYLNFDAIITNENTYKVRQLVYDDDGTTINDSGFLATNTLKCFNEYGYFGLRTEPAAASMYVDYVFSRKYTFDEPWVDVYENEGYYEVIITNDTQENLNDFQIAIPNDVLQLTSKTESLKIEQQLTSNVDNKYIPYYIEDDGNDKYLYIKQTILKNTTKEIKITKENGFFPNGDRVFDFFDDFYTLKKWIWHTTPTLELTGETLRINVGAITLANPLPFNLQDNYIIRTRTKYINQTSSYGGTAPGISSAPFTPGNNSSGESQIEIMKGTTNLHLYVYAGNGTTNSHNLTSTYFSNQLTYNDYYILDIITKTNTFEIYKNYNSVYSYPSTTTFIKNMNYIHLGQYDGSAADIGDTEYDYIFVRKHIETEPTVTVTNMGSYYKVNIENNTNDDLIDYQVKIPNDILELTSKTDSLKIKSQSVTEEEENTKIIEENSRVIAWVKIPALSSENDTNIFMYFGNPKYDIDNSEKVWDKDYLYVEHFNKEDTTNLFDSTKKIKANAYNFDNTDNSNLNANGVFGNSIACDGVNDYIAVPISLSEINENEQLTISLWAKNNSIFKNAMPIGSATPTSARIFLDAYNNSWSRGIGNNSWGTSSSPVTTDWTKLTLTINKNTPTNSKLYVNNDLVYDTHNFIWTNTTTYLQICGFSSYFWNGYVDEVRIEKTIRSDAWRNTEYNNQINPNSFYSITNE